MFKQQENSHANKTNDECFPVELLNILDKIFNCVLDGVRGRDIVAKQVLELRE